MGSLDVPDDKTVETTNCFSKLIYDGGETITIESITITTSVEVEDGEDHNLLHVMRLRGGGAGPGARPREPEKAATNAKRRQTRCRLRWPTDRDTWCTGCRSGRTGCTAETNPGPRPRRGPWSPKPESCREPVATRSSRANTIRRLTPREHQALPHLPLHWRRHHLALLQL